KRRMFGLRFGRLLMEVFFITLIPTTSVMG
ncbi:MAG: hypothetical protein ACI97N_001962, partial [Cognaticolwellia sp.]